MSISTIGYVLATFITSTSNLNLNLPFNLTSVHNGKIGTFVKSYEHLSEYLAPSPKFFILFCKNGIAHV